MFRSTSRRWRRNRSFLRIRRFGKIGQGVGKCLGYFHFELISWPAALMHSRRKDAEVIISGRAQNSQNSWLAGAPKNRRSPENAEGSSPAKGLTFQPPINIGLRLPSVHLVDQAGLGAAVVYMSTQPMSTADRIMAASRKGFSRQPAGSIGMLFLARTPTADENVYRKLCRSSAPLPAIPAHQYGSPRLRQRENGSDVFAAEKIYGLCPAGARSDRGLPESDRSFPGDLVREPSRRSP